MEVATATFFILVWLVFVLIWVLTVMFFYIALFGLMIGLLIMMVLMIIDCAQRDFARPDDRTVWILLIVFTGGIGALVYYFTVKRPTDKLKR
jgi:hypothetical protein